MERSARRRNPTRMNPGLWILLGIGLLLGCQSAPADAGPALHAPPAPACKDPGTVLRSELADTSRGYPYRFNVYLPPCYAAAPRTFYPVLYLVPGRGSGPEAWFAADANRVADDLILIGTVPPFLIVTTETTDHDMYAQAILNDLVPYVEDHYRILKSRDYRAVAGASLGGIAAYRIGFQHPDRFASVGIFGSGLVSGEEKQFDAWLAALTPRLAPRVFLNSGEQDPYMLDRARVMDAILDQAGIESNLVVGAGGHDYAYWVSNLPVYFTWMARDWQMK